MMTCGLFVELEAARDQEASVEHVLDEVLPIVQAEPGQTAWFALQFRGRRYGILGVFADEVARERQLQGPVTEALREHSSQFARPPVFHAVEILGDKLPTTAALERDRKALLLQVTPRRGREDELADFMRGTRSIVDTEPDTTAWFALRFQNGDLGFFDAFPTSRARRKHLLGKAPRELVKNFRLLGGIRRMSLIDVQAERFAS